MLNGAEYKVVGVVSQASRYPAYVQLFAPYVAGPEFKSQRDSFVYTVVGRPNGGVSLEAAQAGIVARNLNTHAGRSLQVVKSAERMTSANDLTARYSKMLTLAAGFVVLIACANVANLQLARVTGWGRGWRWRRA